jgi:prepilin-type N-terminal cleavage/methylation domain-containing protein
MLSRRQRAMPRTSPHPGFTLVETLVVMAVVAVLAMLAFMMTKRSMKRAEMARLASNLRSLSAGVNSYMIDHGKLADIIFGVQYPAREICKATDGVGAGYCGPEWRVRGTNAWKTCRNSSNQVWGWAVADAQLITNQGTMSGITDPSNRPIVFFGNASCSSYQDNLGYPSVITRMREFSKAHLDGTTLVGYMDGGVKTFANVASWEDPEEAWNLIWAPKSRR